MLDRVADYAGCLAAPQDWAVATIVSVRGSSPSPVGTSMAVSADLRIIGSLSGGCVESSVAALAQDAIAEGRPRLESFGPDGTLFEQQGLDVALTCGGEIEVLIQPLSTLDGETLERLRSLSRKEAREPAELSRRIRLDEAAGPDQTAEPAAEPQTAPSEDSVGSAPRELLVEERREGAPVLFLSGVHDVSVHLARLALQAGWRVRMVDVRPAFATAERVPDGVELAVGEPVTALREKVLAAPAGAWTAVCVMTHHPDLDVPVLDAALSEGGRTISFLGAMGSRRAGSRRARALEERGHSPASIASVHTPLGLDIQASTAAETAVSMFAELIAARNAAAGGEAEAEPDDAGARTGAPLSEKTGPVSRSRRRSISITREMAA